MPFDITNTNQPRRPSRHKENASQRSSVSAVHMEDTRVVCSLCGYTCPTKRGLAIHMGKAHKEHQAQQECKHCGKKRTEFSRTDKFTEHCRQCEAKQNENVPN